MASKSLPHSRAINQARRSICEFMEGYNQEASLPQQWVVEIPNFFKLSEIDLYIAIHHSMDVDHLEPWCASFITNRKEKIEREDPYIPLDFIRL